MAIEREQVEAVKMIPISKIFEKVIVPAMGDYYSDYTVDFEWKQYCKCPILAENTPSFKLYLDTNTYYCWGCGSSGDTISLYRNFMRAQFDTNVSFEEAVNYLYKLGSGKDRVLINGYKSLLEITSDNRELLLLSHSLYIIENEMKQYDENDLNDMYFKIDTTLKAIELKRVNAMEAKNIIEEAWKFRKEQLDKLTA